MSFLADLHVKQTEAFISANPSTVSIHRPRRTPDGAGGETIDSKIVDYHSDFSTLPEGNIQDRPIPSPRGRPAKTWEDGLTQAGEAVEMFLESAYVVDGVLRHRGTRLACAAAMEIAGETSHCATVKFSEVLPGPGGGFPELGMPETDYSSNRISFVDGIAGNGYVGYIQANSSEEDHSFLIVRDTNRIPTPIAGPWSAGRRVQPGEEWSFRHAGNEFSILLNGDFVGSVVDETYDHREFINCGIVFNTGTAFLEGITSWSLNYAKTLGALPLPPQKMRLVASRLRGDQGGVLSENGDVESRSMFLIGTPDADIERGDLVRVQGRTFKVDSVNRNPEWRTEALVREATQL